MDETNKRIEYGIKRAVWLRNYQRARSRALARLGQENPDRYKELLEEERAKDEAEGKAWRNIHGRSNAGDTIARSNASKQGKVPIKHTNRDDGRSGNREGEA